MKARSIREFYIQPKIFQSISFHHQGIYAIRLSLYQINPKGRKIYAYPTIKSSSEKQQPILQLKQPKLAYRTQDFSINFNDQSCTIKHGCLFQIQYQNQNYQTCLQFELIHKNKDESQQYQGHEQIVGLNRLFINVSVQQDNSTSSSYQKVLFTSPQYYSCIFIFVEHVRLFNKVRLNPFSQNQLQKLATQQHEQYRQTAKRMSSSRQLTINPGMFQCATTQQIYQLLITSALIQYNKVKSLHHKLTTIVAMHLKSNRSNGQNKIQQMPKNLDSILNQTDKDIVSLFKYYKTNDLNQIYANLYLQSINIGNNIKQVWDSCIDLVLKMRPAILSKTVVQAQQVKCKLLNDNFQILEKDVIGKKWSQLIDLHKQKRQKLIKSSRFYFQNIKVYPMVLASRRVGKKDKKSIQHISMPASQILTVFVHGYKGNQYDMSKIKAHLTQYFNSNFLVIKEIQKNMDTSISHLAQVTALEITQYINQKPGIKRINFIGFSLGGVIIRKCLHHLSEYKTKINMLITFATPHLGVSQVNNCLVKTGMCFMNNISKIKNMKEVCLQQTIQQDQQKFMMKLSKQQSLTWFKHVVLVGCQSDQYVPTYSSLLDYYGENQQIVNIQQNMLSKIRVLHRLNVWFDYKQNFLDWITGRKGHVSFLENDIFLQFFFGRHWKLF